MREVGMTGEITLRGRILPVGGVREKILAAHRAGLKTVIIPRRNKKDLVELPKRAMRELNIKLVDHMDDVLDIALSDQVQASKSGLPKKKSKSRGTNRTGPEQAIKKKGQDIPPMQPGA